MALLVVWTRVSVASTSPARTGSGMATVRLAQPLTTRRRLRHTHDLRWSLRNRMSHMRKPGARPPWLP